MRNIKAKTLMFLLLLSSFSLLSSLIGPINSQTLTEYTSSNFDDLADFPITGDAQLNTTIYRSASSSLKVNATSNNYAYVERNLVPYDFLDFIFTVYVYIPSGETATTRHLLVIYFTNATGNNYLLFQVTYDGANSRMYYRYAHDNQQEYAVTDTKGHTLLTADAWHRLKIGYNSQYGRLFFTIDYSLRRNEPYIVNSTNNPIRMTKLVLGQFTKTAGYSGVQFYDDLTLTAFSPSETFASSSTKQAIFWWGIMNSSSSFVSPTHIGLAAAVSGYYKMGENYTDEMEIHYGNGSRHFIIEAERDTNLTDAEVLNDFKTAHSDVTLYLWYTNNDTYDAHVLHNMTGVDYFIMSSYLNKWATFNLDALYSPMIMFRMYGYEDKAIMALGVDDEHALSYGPTISQFDSQFNWVFETLPLTNGICYFTWTNVSPELQNHILERTKKQLWNINPFVLMAWLCEPDPFVAYNGAALGFNNNFSFTFTTTANRIIADVSSLNTTEGNFYFSSAELSINNIRINNSLTNDYSRLGDKANIYLLELPSGKHWDIEVNFLMPPLLPFLFILGMIGLGGLFGSSLYFVKEIKKGVNQEVFTKFITIFALSFGLFIAWLWGG